MDKEYILYIIYRERVNAQRHFDLSVYVCVCAYTFDLGRVLCMCACFCIRDHHFNVETLSVVSKCVYTVRFGILYVWIEAKQALLVLVKSFSNLSSFIPINNNSRNSSVATDNYA